MIKWLKNFFYNKDDSKLTRSSGRASCAVCNKRLEDNIFTVPNDEYYYCKKHARERLRGLHTPPDKQKLLSSESKNNCYVCEKCNRKLPVWGNDFRFCSKCGNFYCIKDFDNHKCKPKQSQIISTKIKTTHSNNCHYCKKDLNLINRFSCKYCERWFCDEHRLPENHQCKGKVKNPHKFGGRIIYSKNTPEYYTE